MFGYFFLKCVVIWDDFSIFYNAVPTGLPKVELQALGVGINLQPSAVQFLGELGLFPALDRTGIRTLTKIMRKFLEIQGISLKIQRIFGEIPRNFE